MRADLTHTEHCIIIPFYQRLEPLRRCLDALIDQKLENTKILLVNDGTPTALVEDVLQDALVLPFITLIHCEVNRGVSAARNTAIQWCREQHIEMVLMIDSDCLPGDKFIEQHLVLHRDNPAAACFGGGIIGVGKSFWAKLDKVMSWVHSVPHGKIREVHHPYHLPTTNFSVKMSMLPATGPVFDGRLLTGEDALLIRGFRKQGKPVMFSPEPYIYHYDRETMVAVFKHHYIWGYHQYFIQLGGDMSPRSFKPWYRALFLAAFVPCLIVFALLGATLNTLPWIRYKPKYLLFFPLVLLVWTGKAIAVAEAAARPYHCLRSLQ